jgi:hypothetical protein
LFTDHPHYGTGYKKAEGNMDIKISGFEIRNTGSITLGSFFSHLHSIGGVQSGDLIFGVVDKKTHYSGIIILIKDMRAFLTKKNLGGSVTISAETIKDNEDFVVANFFLIDKEKFRGLYSSYHGSCTLNKFLHFLNNRFKVYRNSLISTEVDSFKQKMSDWDIHKLEKKASKKYTGSLKYAILERKEELDKRISRLSELKNFTFEHMALAPENDNFVALPKFAKRISHSLTFGLAQEGRLSALKQTVINVIKGGHIQKGTIKGTDPDGLEVIYKMYNDYDVFERHDYENTIKTVMIDLNNIKSSISSSIIARILEEASAKPQIRAVLQS